MDIHFDVNIPSLDAGFFVTDDGFKFEYNFEKEYFFSKDLCIKCKTDGLEDGSDFEVLSINVVEDGEHLTLDQKHPIYQAVLEWAEKDQENIISNAIDEAFFIAD